MALIRAETVLELDLVPDVGNDAALLVFPAVATELHVEGAIGPAGAELGQALDGVFAVDAGGDDLLFSPAPQLLTTGRRIDFGCSRCGFFLVIAAGACLEDDRDDHQQDDDADELLLHGYARIRHATVRAGFRAGINLMLAGLAGFQCH